MPSVKITFDVADAMKSLEDINQKIQEFADKCLIGHDAAAKLQNRMANKMELNLADSKNKTRDTSTEKKATDDNQGDNQKRARAHIFKPMLGGVLGTDQTDNSYGVMGSLGAQQAASAGLPGASSLALAA